jgi:hypothetical protein
MPLPSLKRFLSVSRRHEEKERAAPRLVANSLTNQAGQTLESEAHVHRIERHEHLHAGGIIARLRARR